MEKKNSLREKKSKRKKKKDGDVETSTDINSEQFKLYIKDNSSEKEKDSPITIWIRVDKDDPVPFDIKEPDEKTVHDLKILLCQGFPLTKGYKPNKMKIYIKNKYIPPQTSLSNAIYNGVTVDILYDSSNSIYELDELDDQENGKRKFFFSILMT